MDCEIIIVFEYCKTVSTRITEAYSPVFRACYDFITKEAIENNLEWLDFTSGDEDYKYKLNGKEMILYSYKIV